MLRTTSLAIFCVSALCAPLALSGPAAAQERAAPAANLTYADLAGLAEAAPLVLRAEVRSQAQLKPERAPGLAPGMARLYVEARTGALLSGNAPVGELLKYLVDVPLDAKGRAPKLKKQQVLLFARPVPGRPGEIQLVGPGAQQLWTPELEARLRPVLAAFVAPDARPAITGVRDALSVSGNLAGESETQIFLSTRSGDPVSLSVVRRPGMSPVWGVSWTEIVDQSAREPQANTLEWYRLACALPDRLPPQANLSRDAASRARASEDYAYVLQRLGPCQRTLARD